LLSLTVGNREFTLRFVGFKSLSVNFRGEEASAAEVEGMPPGSRDRPDVQVLNNSAPVAPAMVTKTVVHFEIPASDVGKLSKFYSDLFGWKFEKMPMGGGMEYWTIATGPRNRSVGGGMYKKQMEMESPRNYVAVDDIDLAIASLKNAGGSEAVGKQEVPGMGWSFIGMDPEGNAIGLFQGTSRPPRRATRAKSRKSARRTKSRR